MREALNQNPVVQMALLAVLGLAVGFLLFTRVLGGSDSGSTEPAASTSASSPSTASPAVPSTEATTGSAPADAAPAPVGAAPVTGGEAGPFEAGPGLPAAVVSAYEHGDTVLVLVTKHDGIDDRPVRALVRGLRGRNDVALFTTSARNIARYSRITGGVDVDRVPALTVVSPRRVNGDEPPQASVSYGFRGPDSIVQAVRDAAYDGRKLPYYPR